MAVTFRKVGDEIRAEHPDVSFGDTLKIVDNRKYDGMFHVMTKTYGGPRGIDRIEIIHGRFETLKAAKKFAEEKYSEKISETP